MNLRNISWAMGLVLLGSVAMPSLARKKKVQPVQKPAVQEEHLSPNERQRYNYFFLEGARQQAAGNYSAAFDLFEHARKIDPKAAETYFYESLFYSQLKQDSLALAYMQKAIELDPENQTYAEQLARYYLGSQKYDLAIDAYENLYAKNHDNTDALRILLKYSARLNSLDCLAVTRLDILDKMPKIKMCVGYKIDGQEIKQIPASLNVLAKVEPVFEEFEGWLTDITSIRTFDELPVQAKTYLNRLSEVAGVELGIVSVGPEREQTIVLKKLL